LEDDLSDHLFWVQFIKALRGHRDAKLADHIIEEIIEEYKTELESDQSGNRLLWVYSSYSASRGFDPFEPRRDLGHEVL